jgi:hypothetical protein
MSEMTNGGDQQSLTATFNDAASNNTVTGEAGPAVAETIPTDGDQQPATPASNAVAGTDARTTPAADQAELTQEAQDGDEQPAIPGTGTPAGIDNTDAAHAPPMGDAKPSDPIFNPANRNAVSRSFNAAASDQPPVPPVKTGGATAEDPPQTVLKPTRNPYSGPRL